MTMEDTQDNYPAVFTVHTPSGPTDACIDHTNKMVALFRFMGTHVVFETAQAGAQCKNCINEAKEKDGTR